MLYILYKTTNLINGKIYIGVHQTDDINDRYLGSGFLLKDSIKKHGRKNFKREILEYFPSKEEMYKKESEIVTEEFIKRPDVYNRRLGGEGGWQGQTPMRDPEFRKMYGISAEKSSEIGSYLRDNKIGMFSDEYKLKNPKGGFFGGKLSDEAKQKISISMTGRFSGDKNPSKRDDVREKKRIKMKGRKPTNTGKILVYNPIGGRVYINKDELQSYLDSGHVRKWRVDQQGVGPVLKTV